MYTSGAGRQHETYIDVIKASKLECLVLVDGRPQVLAVVTVLDALQLAHTAHISQARLHLSHVGNLEHTDTYRAIMSRSQYQW